SAPRFLLLLPPPPPPPLFPYTTLFRSARLLLRQGLRGALPPGAREHRQAGGLRDRLHDDLARQRPAHEPLPARPLQRRAVSLAEDRKSTRLNSSHLVISYAVFCLKKKK